MSEETCPGCKRPFATTAHEQAFPAHCNGVASYGCLTQQLAAATARASELERELEGCVTVDTALASQDELAALVAQRDTELVAMGERVARLETAARAVVAADTYPMPGKTRFEATTEAIGKLEALLPDLPAVCAANPDGKGETNG